MLLGLFSLKKKKVSCFKLSNGRKQGYSSQNHLRCVVVHPADSEASFWESGAKEEEGLLVSVTVHLPVRKAQL